MVTVVLILGFISLFIGPIMSAIRTSQKSVYRQQEMIVNQKIGDAMLDWSESYGMLGTLPAPYTGKGYVKTVVNAASVAKGDIELTGLIANKGVRSNQMDDDATGSQKVRVYQRAQGLRQSLPFFGKTGPLAHLKFDFGLITMTDCPFGTVTCNTASTSTGIPDAITALTSANYSTISTANVGLGVYGFSTAPLQKEKMLDTGGKISRIKNEMQLYFAAKSLAAGNADITNWYPSSTSSLAGQNPMTLQGCADGWYDLNVDANILNTVGLDPAYFGITSWGAKIQYCRDYDPANTGASTPPHYGAIRINKNLSDALAPDIYTASNNLIFSF